MTSAPFPVTNTDWVLHQRKLLIARPENDDIMDEKDIVLSELEIGRRIYQFRGHRVMLDRDLATLYGVETFNLNKAVKRNCARFPGDFAFQLTKEEYANLTFQIGISSSRTHGGRRHLPHVFTELGVAMLSSVLNSEKAILVNVVIMRTFVTHFPRFDAASSEKGFIPNSTVTIFRTRKVQNMVKNGLTDSKTGVTNSSRRAPTNSAIEASAQRHLLTGASRQDSKIPRRPE